MTKKLTELGKDAKGRPIYKGAILIHANGSVWVACKQRHKWSTSISVYRYNKGTQFGWAPGYAFIVVPNNLYKKSHFEAYAKMEDWCFDQEMWI